MTIVIGVLLFLLCVALVAGYAALIERGKRKEVKKREFKRRWATVFERTNLRA